MKTINNLAENFEDELETILRDEGIIDENGMVYADHVIASQPFSSKDERVEFVQNECISFIDDEYIYICKNDGTGDYGVERVLIRKYSELLSLVVEEDAEEFESYDVYFKIVSNKNEEVYVEGYVTINDEEAEDADWYYYDAQGFATSQVFVEHDGVDGFKGATDEQKQEVEQFKVDWREDSFWIDEVILQSDEDENRTYVRENLTLIINEGAMFELEYEDYTSKEWDSDYYMAFTPKFNGEKIILDGDVYFQDPYTYEHLKVNTDILYKNGSYIVQIPAGYWEDDDFSCDEIISEYETSFKRAYAQSISKKLSIYSEYGENVEQLFEECDIKEIALVTDDNLQEFLVNEGIIDE